MNDTTSDDRRAERWSKYFVLALGGIFVFGMLGFAMAVLDARDEPEPTEPPPPSLPAIPTVTGSVGATADQDTEPRRILLAVADTEATPAPAASVSPSSSPSPSTTVAPGVPADAPAVEPELIESRMPVVPVARFWTRRSSIDGDAITKALERGELAGFSRILVETAIADALAAELGIDIHEDVRLAEPDRIRQALTKGALGLVSATSVGPSMRALEIDGRSLTGNERLREVTDWPLSVSLSLPEADAWDQERTWVLVAGGDSFTDRGVYDTVVRKGKGVDYPFDGGTARVTGHGCCDPVFNDNIVPRYVLTGNKGAVRKLFKGAELAIANHEQPVTESAAFHSSGTRFGGKPALTRIFTRAGIDFLSLANNHIGDYGSDGIRDTRRILRQNGIAFGGAGKDLAQARKTNLIEVGDTRVAIIPCLDIVRVYWAADGKAGATPCVDQFIKKDIRKAKRAGADVIVVFPHWGVEYTRQPLTSMRKHADRWVEAGAGLVVGGHSHVAGAIEEIDGAPVLYSLGNLIFDQHWSTNTMESALLEATFHGAELVELRLRPYIIHDTSQPNFLDPAKGEGRRLLRSIRDASANWLEW